MTRTPAQRAAASSMDITTIVIRRQTELRSRQWGIYINNVLIEGGFVTKRAALAALPQCL